MYVDWGLAGAVIITGLVIVFVLLIVLIWMVMATGKLVKSTEANSANSAPKPVAPAAKPVVPVAPVVQSGIEEETVAAITAAVYMTLNAVSEKTGVSYAIKSISRASVGRPVWGFAGMQHNTRPF